MLDARFRGRMTIKVWISLDHNRTGF